MAKREELETPVLKLPLIGKIGEKIECLDVFKKGIELASTGTLKEKQGLIGNLERALGQYLWDSKQYLPIIKLLFPKKGDIDVGKIIAGDDGDIPLFARVFARAAPVSESTGDSKNELEQVSSAWSALMLDLGEFKLDEHFYKQPETLKNMIEYTCFESSTNQHSVLCAQFEPYIGLIEMIWKRILSEDTWIIFIDDNKHFKKKWGLPDSVEVESVNKDTELGKIVWIYTGEDYDESKTNKEIEVVADSFKKQQAKEKNIIFVIDLLFKKNKINRIKGDGLIRHIRGKHDINPLIIGFTGGKSPFIINSAVKAGADIVIMKERGETVEIPRSHGSGNAGGLFDLLWALSKNLSRWRFLEKYKKYVSDKIDKQKGFYKPVLNRLFFSIENETPFWRTYLIDWQREIENLRLKAIFKDKPDE